MRQKIFACAFRLYDITEGAETRLSALLHLKRGSLSQVSLKIRFKMDCSSSRWTALMRSGYEELEYFIWGHGAATQKAGVKEEKLAGRMTDETGHVMFYRGRSGPILTSRC